MAGNLDELVRSTVWIDATRAMMIHMECQTSIDFSIQSTERNESIELMY